MEFQRMLLKCSINLHSMSVLNLFAYLHFYTLPLLLIYYVFIYGRTFSAAIMKVTLLELGFPGILSKCLLL